MNAAGLYDRDAELAVVGDMFTLPDCVAEVSRRLTAADFFDPQCAEAFDAIVRMHRRGETADAVTLGAELRKRGYDDPTFIVDLHTASVGGWRQHVKLVIDYRIRREIASAVADIPGAVRDPGTDPLSLIDELRGRLAHIDAPTASSDPADLWFLDEFIDLPEPDSEQWVVPGLVGRDWRIVVVAGEGAGKSVLFRMFAVMSAQGVNPLLGDPMPPVKTLLVDLENPSKAIKTSCRILRDSFDAREYEPGRAFLWHRPGGVDLRTRAGRSEFEAVLAACRPDLVCMGPLYKAYTKKGNEAGDEQAVAEVQAVFDDLRTRYGFGLLLEHHAPHGTSPEHRDLRPYGSTLWLRWPEIGLAMHALHGKDEPRYVELKRWRGDRLNNQWPDYLRQGRDWPWVAA
jgi:hypothetical protein